MPVKQIKKAALWSDQKEMQKVALIGNPNVGKSTIFNQLTGMHQHTGNWPGKTVDVAWGTYSYKGKAYTLVDLPGTYSLISQSEEERIAADFICSDQVSCTVVVADGTCLERNLYLCLQIMEITDRVILCVNLLDEAQRSGIQIELDVLERQLGIPVVGTAAGSGEGIDLLCEKVRNMADGFLPTHPKRLWKHSDQMGNWSQKEEDSASKQIADRAAMVIEQVVKQKSNKALSLADRLVLGRWSGKMFLFLILMMIFWITIKGANYPSVWLQRMFDTLGAYLYSITGWMPHFLQSLLLEGVYATLSTVISVMLPPMSIFFPLFTCLEDLGYLPRAAFMIDHWFQRAGSCGKQVLTMSMGFGCNAAAIVGCRIIASPRERLMAIVTNAFVPCNGKFPTLIALSFLLFADKVPAAAIFLSFVVLLGIILTMVSTKLLSSTILAGEESVFYLEIPPFRRPQLKKVLIRSVLDRTLLILGRAVVVAAPVGGIVWILQTLSVGDQPLLLYISEILEPFGSFFGMNGIILLAFLLSLPANELLLPMMIVITGETGNSFQQLFAAHGWNTPVILCTMVFCLLHWPCSTTCLTIRKETGNWRWALLSIILPSLFGLGICFIIKCICALF